MFFYKRAQIFVADVHLCFQGQGLGAFSDIAQLTCFADYRLPQLMMHLDILRYDEPLRERVLNKEVNKRKRKILCRDIFFCRNCIFCVFACLQRHVSGREEKEQ